MKLLLIGLMFCSLAIAEKGIRIDASVSTIPAAFASDSTGSEAIACGAGLFSIVNDTSTDIYWQEGKAGTAPGSTSNPPIPDGWSYSGKFPGPVQSIYVRSASGSAISTGKIQVTCEGQE